MIVKSLMAVLVGVSYAIFINSIFGLLFEQNKSEEILSLLLRLIISSTVIIYNFQLIYKEHNILYLHNMFLTDVVFLITLWFLYGGELLFSFDLSPIPTHFILLLSMQMIQVLFFLSRECE